MLDAEGNETTGASIHYAAALRDMTRRYERLVRGLSLLKQIDQIDHPDLSFEQVCLSLMRILAQGFAAENCSLLLFDSEKSELVLCAAASALDDKVSFIYPDLWTGKRFRLGEGIAGQAAVLRRLIRCDDVRNEADFVRLPDSPVEIHALMCIPLLVEMDLVGVVNLSHSKPSAFSAESERIMSIVGDRCARLLSFHLHHHERHRADDYYRLVAERVGDGVMVFDAEDKLVNANATIESLSGRPIQDLLSGDVLWEDGVAPEDREKFQQHRQRVHNSTNHETLEYFYKNAAGRTHLLEERCTALTDPNGTFRGYVCIVRDLTQQRRMEEEKRYLEEELRHAQKMEAIGRLAGGVAHDFNNLLTGILGNITLAQTINDLQVIKRLLSEAEKATRRAAEVTKQLLTMSRKSPSVKRQINIADILPEIENILRNTFEPSIELAFFVEPGLWEVLAAPDQIHQVLMNLCVNARDALLAKKKQDPAALLRLDVTAENVVVEEDFCKKHLEAHPGHYVTLTVSDTGTGIDKSIRQLIFEPFFTTKDETTGTGLGLSIVYAIVKEHNGWLSFWTEVGQGTTFQVFLPVACRPERTQSVGHREIPDHLHGSETVLFVDDEEIIQRLGRSILEPYGYKLLMAQDGKEAIRLFERHANSISAVILDLLLPHLSGEEVLRHVRKTHPHMRVIVSTGKVENLPDDLVGSLTPNAYLQKPYSHIDLLRTLRLVLDAPPTASS